MNDDAQAPASGRLLFRVVALGPRAQTADAGGPLWFPRPFQRVGRHDRPELYGCLYAATDPASAVAESLAPFRGAGRLHESMLVRMGRALSLVSFGLADPALLVDLDDPRVLAREKLRPSGVATRARAVTQALAARLWHDHPNAAGLRWWSTLEASWINVTLFDRCSPSLTVDSVRALTLDDPDLLAAAEFLGLRAP